MTLVTSLESVYCGYLKWRVRAAVSVWRINCTQRLQSVAIRARPILCYFDPRLLTQSHVNPSVKESCRASKEKMISKEVSGMSRALVSSKFGDGNKKFL